MKQIIKSMKCSFSTTMAIAKLSYFIMHIVDEVGDWVAMVAWELLVHFVWHNHSLVCDGGLRAICPLKWYSTMVLITLLAFQHWTNTQLVHIILWYIEEIADPDPPKRSSRDISRLNNSDGKHTIACTCF